MYIHIGEDIDIRGSDLIAILDRKSVNSTVFIEEFLQRNRKNIIDLSKKSVKSIVITKDKVYLSSLASETLKNRFNVMSIQKF